MTGLRLITFDLDNTLWPVEEVIRRAEKQCGLWIADEHPEAAAVLTTEGTRAFLKELVSENPRYLDNLTALRIDAMTRGFQAAGYPKREAQQAARAAFDVFHEARNEVVFFPGALEILEKLAGSYELGALSNGNADLERIGIGDLFSFHHSAESVGRRKPAPDMFEAALRSAGAAPERALHVGDHPREDVAAARDHGWHAVWANLIDLDWPDDLAEHPHRIHNLHELNDLVTLLDG
jgi:HAD superfamily hydrolase (TIGR01509 family)